MNEKEDGPDHDGEENDHGEAEGEERTPLPQPTSRCRSDGQARRAYIDEA